ncbi:MAG: hypothetical protein LAT63_13085 [Marinobacter sp.]|nr:hypothetical protein [Marinobacter sp.]
MKQRIALPITTVSIAFGLWLFWPEELKEAPPSPLDGYTPAIYRDAAAAQPAAAEPLPIDERSLQEIMASPQFRAFEARSLFEEDMRGFLETADILPEDERARRAAALQAELERFEAARQLSAVESVMLQTALIRATETDPQAQQNAIADLLVRYSEDHEVRMEAWRNRVDPVFARYKEKERVIVQEVMAMERFPDGMDRGQYLRQRLLEARIEATREAESTN